MEKWIIIVLFVLVWIYCIKAINNLKKIGGVVFSRYGELDLILLFIVGVGAAVSLYVYL